MLSWALLCLLLVQTCRTFKHCDAIKWKWEVRLQRHLLFFLDPMDVLVGFSIKITNFLGPLLFIQPHPQLFGLFKFQNYPFDEKLLALMWTWKCYNSYFQGHSTAFKEENNSIYARVAQVESAFIQIPLGKVIGFTTQSSSFSSVTRFTATALKR